MARANVRIKGASELRRAFERARSDLAPALVQPVDEAARLALAVSAPLVPVATGGLANSGSVTPGHLSTRTIATASAQYRDPDGTAAFVHEGAHGPFTKSAPPRFLRIGFRVAAPKFRKACLAAVLQALGRSFK